MNIEDNDVVIENKDNLIKINDFVASKNFSNEIIKGNENTEIPLGVQAKKELDAPSLVQSFIKPSSFQEFIRKYCKIIIV
jgi:hypothetical protein